MSKCILIFEHSIKMYDFKKLEKLKLFNIKQSSLACKEHSVAHTRRKSDRVKRGVCTTCVNESHYACVQPFMYINCRNAIFGETAIKTVSP